MLRFARNDGSLRSSAMKPVEGTCENPNWVVEFFYNRVVWFLWDVIATSIEAKLEVRRGVLGEV